MYYADEITSVPLISEVQEVADDGPRPVGPIRTRPLLLTLGFGPPIQGKTQKKVYRISQDAALELAAKLKPLLQARGCQWP